MALVSRIVINLLIIFCGKESKGPFKKKLFILNHSKKLENFILKAIFVTALSHREIYLKLCLNVLENDYNCFIKLKFNFNTKITCYFLISI